MHNVAEAPEPTPVQPDIKPDQGKDAGNRIWPILRFPAVSGKLLQCLDDLVLQKAWAGLRLIYIVKQSAG